MLKQIKLYEAFGKSEFRVVKQGKTAQQLMKHVVDKLETVSIFEMNSFSFLWRTRP